MTEYLEVPHYFPDWVQRVTVPIWLSRADEPKQPDRLIIDFDASDDGGIGGTDISEKEQAVLDRITAVLDGGA